MVKSRAQLDQMLAALDASVPSLLQDNPAPDAFWRRFTSLADEIQHQADSGERGWVCDRLDAIQVGHLLVPPADQI